MYFPSNRADNWMRCLQINEAIMILCMERQANFEMLVLTAVLIISTIVCGCCSYVCYKRRFAPGAPGINVVCCAGGRNKEAGEEDELGRV